MDRFQPGNEQCKHNADQRDQAHQLPGLELIFFGLHWRLRWKWHRVQVSAYSNFHSVANVCSGIRLSVSFWVLTKVFGQGYRSRDPDFKNRLYTPRREIA